MALGGGRARELTCEFLGAEPLCLRPNTVPLVLGSDIQPFFISLLFEDVEVYSIAKRIK